MSEHGRFAVTHWARGSLRLSLCTRRQSSWAAQGLGGSCRAANSLIRSKYDGKLPSIQRIVCGVALGAFTLNTAWTSIPA
jgi:hypothetical protein